MSVASGFWTPASAAAVVWTVAAVGVHAQSGRPYPVLGLEQGLTQSSILAMADDPARGIWFGTQNGLNLYDGHRIRTYRVGAASGLESDHIRDLALDTSGRLWVATVDGGLYVEREGRWGRLAQVGDTILSIVLPTARPPVVAGPRRIWVLDEDGSVRTQVDLETLGFGTPIVTAATVNDEVWVGSTAGSVSRCVLGPSARCSGVTRHPLGAPVRAVAPIGDSVWIGTDGAGVFHARSDGSGQPVAVDLGAFAEQELRIRAIAADQSRDVWVGTNAGALWIRGAVGRRVFPGGGRDDPLPNGLVLSLMEDRVGNMWIGSWDGAVRVPRHRQALEPLTDQGRLEGTVALTRSGPTLLAGGIGGWIRQVAPPNGSSTALTLPEMGDSDVYSMAEGADGRLWVATIRGGLWSRDNGRWTRHPLMGAVTDSDVPAVFVDSRGTVWAGSRWSGLWRTETGGGQDEFQLVPGTQEQHVPAITEDPSGAIWFVTHGTTSELVRVGGAVDGGGQRHALAVGRALTVSGLHDGRLAVGSQGEGLVLFDPATESQTIFDITRGLPHNTVASVVEAPDGTLWIGTNDGLARLDPRTNEVHTFSRAVGTAGDRYYANAGYSDGRSGRLYFGGPRGITVVDPSLVRLSSQPPPVVLSALAINASPRSPRLARAGLDLAPDENFFTFTFAALDFTDPSQNRYQYRLEPLDEEWVDAGANNVANYTSVPSGDYVFHVKARNADGVWNEDGLAIPVFVATPWYNTLWARTLGLLVVLAAISALYLYRLRQLQARQQLRLNIAGKLHDDIGANLSAMAIKVQRVGQSRELSEARRRQLADVVELARDTVEKVRETVWVVNTQYDTVHGLVTRMRDTAETLLDPHVRVHFDAPSTLPRKPIHMELRQDVYLVFKEALHNVLKHAGASRVDIRIRYDEPELSVSVRDDGRGFDPGARPNGNGLALMKERIARRKGSVVVESEPGSGTAVRLSVRMK